MEITITKVTNGYIVKHEAETEDGFHEETHVFPKYYQVVKFLKEHLDKPA